MKLHQVEVHNLASLYGTHRLDLDDQLGGAGLFLVQGPTGSGKSTLMDGVSLALFGTTPRLGPAAKGDAVADALMSRGTGEARASLVFSTRTPEGRVTWRATWAARRAWKRHDGEIQRVERGLERWVDEGWLPLVTDHRAREYGPHFERALEGFSVEDFSRSMLLAQGQFDAFLKAKEEERASILERLTDTREYSRLGARAARMARAWRGRVERLSRRLAGLAGVDTAAEARAKLDLDQAEHDRARLGAEVGGLDALGRWWAEGDRRREALARAEASVAEVARDEEAAAPTLETLAAHERHTALFARCDEVERLRRDRAELAKRRDALAAAHPRLEAEAAAAHGRLEAAAAALETAERRLADLRAPAEAARAAEAELGQARREALAAGQAVEVAAAAVASADRAAATSKEQRSETAIALERARAELAADTVGARLDTALPGLRDRASAAKERARTHADRARAHDIEAQRTNKAEAELGQERADHARSRAGTRTPLDAAVEAAREALAAQVPEGTDPAAHRAALEAEAVRWERLKDQTSLTIHAFELATEQARNLLPVERAIDDLRGQVPAAEAALAQAQGEARTRRGLADTLRGSLERAMLAASLAEHRTVLAEGEACPLCGSREHPVVDDPEVRRSDAAERAALGSLRGDTEAAERQARAAENAAVEEGARLEALRKAERERTAEAANARARLAELTEAARRAAQAADLDPHAGLADARAAEAAADGARQAARSAIAGLDRTREALAAAQERLRKADDDAAAQEQALEQRRSALAARRGALETDAVELERLAGEAAGAARSLQEAVTALGLPAAGTPAEQLAAAEASARTWQQRRTAFERADRALADAEAEVRRTTELARLAADALAAAAARLGERQETARGAEFARDRALVSLLEVWRAVTGADPADLDRPPAEASPGLLVQSQERWVAKLTQATREQRRLAEEARSNLATAVSRLEEIGHAWDTLHMTLTTAEAAFAAGIAAAGLGSATELPALRLPDLQVETLRGTRESLSRRSTEARTILSERTRATEEHAAARDPAWPALDPPAAAERAERARVEQADADARRERAAQVLRDAEAGREARRLAEAELVKASGEAAVWLRLHDLVGKGDGKAFRTYAQALNLAQVLDRANGHLRRLHERYRLVGGSDEGRPTLGLEVEDTWQVGARRELCTLSGGETFLVSLALALGLSDLRTIRLPIETLLLDEGFGTLDADTLDVALAALEQLQATGRQVGVISHVQALQERFPARVQVVPKGGGRSVLEVG